MHPSSRIVKLPTQGNPLKSSLKNSPNKNKRKQHKQHLLQQQESIAGSCPPSSSPPRPFCIKPAPSDVSPVLVFLNPKSGGNQVRTSEEYSNGRYQNFLFLFAGGEADAKVPVAAEPAAGV